MLIQVTANGTAQEFDHDGPLVVGRQSVERGDPPPLALVPAASGRVAKLVVAGTDQVGLGREALRLDPAGPGRVRITANRPVVVRAGAAERLEANQSTEKMLPAAVVLGDVVLKLTADTGFQSLASATIAPTRVRTAALPDLPQFNTAQLDDLVQWMQYATAVFQSTLTSTDFVHAAAEALVNIVRLDNGRVFLRRGNEWEKVAQYPAHARPLPPSTTVLERVKGDGRTFWKANNKDRGVESTSVLDQLSTVVAAPIKDADGQVVGVLYGEKVGAAGSVGKPEALLVEMLACGIATGLSRQRHEEKAVRAEERFAQFFSRELAEELARNPGLLDAREADVSMAFADIRGFSRISADLGPAETVRWLSEIAGALTAATTDEGGMVVDYVGDEVLGMWGAPVPRPDHAARAVRSAAAMLAALPKLNERWATRSREPIRLGIGVNSGPVVVGNIGSAQKFKYGAIGNTVNTASRVQGITKYLKVPLLVTAATRASLDREWVGRRVVRARPANLPQSVDLYEVSDDPLRAGFFAESEAALDALESKRFADAARTAGGLLGRYPGDGPLQLILSRAAAAILDDGKDFNPDWTPPGK